MANGRKGSQWYDVFELEKPQRACLLTSPLNVNAYTVRTLGDLLVHTMIGAPRPVLGSGFERILLNAHIYKKLCETIC
jgi:hypothetical protein